MVNISIAPGYQDLNYTVSKGNQKTWVAWGIEWRSIKLVFSPILNYEEWYSGQTQVRSKQKYSVFFTKCPKDSISTEHKPTQNRQIVGFEEGSESTK